MEVFLTIAKDYGLFAALVVFVIFDSRQREVKYIKREDKYLAVIKTLSEEVKDRLTKIETAIRRKS